MKALAQIIEENRRDSFLMAGSLVLTLAAVGCLIGGLYGASLELSNYGLVSSYPPIFFVGLVLLPLGSACLWFSSRRLDGIILSQLLLLLVSLWLSPYLLESTPRFRAAYKNFGAVDWLLQGNGFNPESVVYHNWPLFPTIVAGFIKVTSIDPINVMGLFPFVIQIAYLFPMILLLRGLRRSDNRWWAGIWFFYIFNWTGQDYFSPQAFAFLLFLSLISVFAYVASKREGKLGSRLMAVTLVLYAALVLTHALTAGMLFIIMAALILGGMLKHRSLLLTFFMMFVAWQVYGAFPFFSLEQERLVSGLFEPTDFFNLSVGDRLAGNPDHTRVGYFRMLATFLAFALAGLVLVFSIFQRNRGTNQPGGRLRTGFNLSGRGDFGHALLPGMLSFSLLFIAALFVMAPLYAYGGEILIRVLLFSLPALSLLLVSALSSRIAVLVTVAVLAMMAPFHILVHYGNELQDYVSPGELAGFSFVASELPPANLYGGYPGAAFENVQQLDWRHAVPAGKNKLPTVDSYVRPDQYRWEYPDRPIYIALSRGDDAAARLFYNRSNLIEDVRAEIVGRCDFELIFDNGDYAVYRWYAEPSDCDDVRETRGAGTGDLLLGQVLE